MAPGTPFPLGGVLVDPDVRSALEACNLRSLPPTVIADLAQGATRLTAEAGSVIHREGETGPHLEVVVTGLVRAYVTALDGRTMTVRYCRPGAMLGVVTLFPPSFTMPASTQAVTDADLLTLRPSVVKDAAERDVRVARALVDELSERVLSFITEIPGSAFATVRQRVARHLLDLASEGQSGPELVAATSQQALADAVGTVREVVVRALRELRHEGLLRTQRDGIAILDPQRLAGMAYPGHS